MQTHQHEVERVRQLTGDGFVIDMAGPIPPTLSGQFYMVQSMEGWPGLLPRPLSLYDRRDGGAVGSLLGKAIGPCTQALRELRPGDLLSLTGPLGKPFPEDVTEPVCIAGGVGLAPFLLLARKLHEAGQPPMQLLFGGRDAAALAGAEDFDGLARVSTATEDGSHGLEGRVTELLEQQIGEGAVATDATIFCCGPDPMMEAVARCANTHQMRCFVSLETYMACGYGVCNGCSVEVQGERFGGWPYSRTCQEGPVYATNELTW